MKWPGKVRTGTESNHIGSFADVMPTLLEIANAEKANYTDGLSIVATLTGNTDKQEKHSYLYWEFHEDGGRQAVRMGNWKGIRLNVKKGTGITFELYDLSIDPKEQNNIAEQHPEISTKMKAYMKEAHQPSALFPFISN